MTVRRRLARLEREVRPEPPRPAVRPSRALLGAAVRWASPDAVAEFVADVQAIADCAALEDPVYSGLHWTVREAQLRATAAARRIDLVIFREGEDATAWRARVDSSRTRAPYLDRTGPRSTSPALPTGVLAVLADGATVAAVLAAVAALDPADMMPPFGVQTPGDLAAYVGLLAELEDLTERRAREEAEAGPRLAGGDPEADAIAARLLRYLGPPTHAA